MLKETVEWCKPTRATKYSAMVDLYAKDEVVVNAGETKIINLGVKIDKNELMSVFLPDDMDLENYDFSHKMSSHFIELHPRSSLRVKGLIVGVGVIDLDYPDEFGLIVHNPIKENLLMNVLSLWFKRFKGSSYEDEKIEIENENFKILKGDKIAQCTLVEHKGYLMGISSNTERDGGFGSTNKNK